MRDVANEQRRKSQWTFELRHLLFGTTAIGIWLALLFSYQVLAIAVGVSLMPALAILAFLQISGNRRFAAAGRFEKVVLLVALACILFLIYTLSVGPATLLIERNLISAAAPRIFYEPLKWLHENTILERPLGWYVHQWR